MLKLGTMANLEKRVTELIQSPLGCAFLLSAEVSGLSPREIAKPIFSFYLGAYASHLIEVWRGADRDRVLPEVLHRGSQKVDLAQAILEETATEWWFAPLDIGQQLYVPRDGNLPDPDQLIAPDTPPTRSERYTQRHERGLFTSTLIEGTSSLYVALDDEVADIGLGWHGPPYRSWLMSPSPSARILEVNGALDWHELCARYPAEGRSDAQTPDFSADEGRLVPDWSAVAIDWDAVHLSFGGLLASDQVRIESPKGWTYLWGWDMEQTLWLRWMFDASARLKDHEPMRSPVKGLIDPPLINRLLGI